MINPESRSAQWIESLRSKYPNIRDASLLEKSIRAFSLLESLKIAGCPFIFKGGTFTAPVITVESLYASQYRANAAYSAPLSIACP
jgi:hypothetical protein